MGLIDLFVSVAKVLPEVKVPARPVSIKEKIMWTIAALVIFFIMYNVSAFGVKQQKGSTDFLQVITASNIGSLLTVGIGPIVLASIFLQLFKGAGLVNFDFSKTEERRKFHEVQKVLAIILAFVESAIFVYSGKTILIDQSIFIFAIVIIQIAFSAIILFYLDEVISRYGIGSGVSLFIAAGVSFTIIGHLSMLIFGENGVIATLIGGGADAIPSAILVLLPFVFTLIVFYIVVYAEGMKVEIPIAHKSAKGIINSLPFKFFYVSNIPVIFASALLLNVQLFGGQLVGALESLNLMVGEYNAAHFLGVAGQDNMLNDGLLYLITPIYASQGTMAHLTFLTVQTTQTFGIPEWVHALIYVIFLMLSSILFGVFWAETSGMTAKSVAEQIEKSSLQIPGYRRDPRNVEKVLSRHITPLIIASSAAVGLLAGIADLTGALGTGTGILLTVGILYKMYEEFDKLKVFDIYPQMSKLFSG